MTKRAFALTLIAAACGAPGEVPLPLEICVEDAYLMQSTRVAAARWEHATGVPMHVRRGCVGAHDVSVAYVERGKWSCSDTLWWDGCTTGFSEIRVTVGENNSEAFAQLVLLHELGHALSRRSGHPDEKPAVMNAAPTSETITAVDLDWVCGETSCAWWRVE